MTRAEAAREAAARLAAAGIDTPELDARVLALEAFSIPHARLLAEGAAIASLDETARLDGFVARRVAGEPVARILGRREFWGLDFALAPETLEPRPDSETVVSAALAAAGATERSLSILDLGTGTGCLLLALLSERTNAVGLGIDLSPAAAAAARRNARALGLGGRARFVAGDWAASVAGRFDLVVSNPPCIAAGDIEGLAVEVRAHDPRLSLDGGADGLDAYRAIVADLPRLLGPGGFAVFEIGAGQADAVSGLARAAGFAAEAAPDLAGAPRALVLRRDDTPW